MRKMIVAGNWKMNTDLAGGVKLAEDIASLAEAGGRLPASAAVEMVVCPPSVNLFAVSTALREKPYIHVGAQNCHSEEKGAYTGEVSGAMIKAAGAEYVILGHSERRTYFKEDHEFLQKKVDRALQLGLKPIFCCGEVLAEREAGVHFEIVKKQLEESLFHLSATDLAKLVIAYEPVWAIGTGRTATPQQAQEMHTWIRFKLNLKYGEATAAAIPILYGGSCNAKNAAELFANPDVDGGLIGGASLVAADFVEIAHFALNAADRK